MNINNDHFTGFLFGVGAAAAAYYFYRKNQPDVDEFLRRQGIELPVLQQERDLSSYSLDELIREKERLEDLIAEREAGGGDVHTSSGESPAAPEVS
ncbi:MAG: hypothetical protein MAG453_00439 [Calditrichaeota bacterium]|nr:hypothetical protein [Calditrichota bacterium]